MFGGNFDGYVRPEKSRMTSESATYARLKADRRLDGSMPENPPAMRIGFHVSIQPAVVFFQPNI